MAKKKHEYNQDGVGYVPASETDTSNNNMSGGMDMMSGFAQLGAQIQDDVLQSMDFFKGIEADRRNRMAAEKSFREGVRQFNLGNAQTNRAQNMSGLEMLAQQRQNAEGAARRRPQTFRDAFVKAM